jgi:hypothetical protein
VIVISVPPATGPAFGTIELTEAGMYVNCCEAVIVPAAVVTSTLAGPSVPAGVVASNVLPLTTVKLLAGVPPMLTALVLPR